MMRRTPTNHICRERGKKCQKPDVSDSTIWPQARQLLTVRSRCQHSDTPLQSLSKWLNVYLASFPIDLLNRATVDIRYMAGGGQEKICSGEQLMGAAICLHDAAEGGGATGDDDFWVGHTRNMQWTSPVGALESLVNVSFFFSMAACPGKRDGGRKSQFQTLWSAATTSRSPWSAATTSRSPLSAATTTENSFGPECVSVIVFIALFVDFRKRRGFSVLRVNVGPRIFINMSHICH